MTRNSLCNKENKSCPHVSFEVFYVLIVYLSETPMVSQCAGSGLCAVFAVGMQILCAVQGVYWL